MNCYLYQHIRLDNNDIFYIGIGYSKNFKRAYSKHCRNKFWKNIVKKTEYKVEILFENLTWEEACMREQCLIKLYGRRDLGKGTLVNMTDGGEGSKNIKHSIESKIKIGIASKNRIWSDESRKKISDSKLGHKHSDETIEKMKTSRKNRIFSDESKKKMSESHKGFKHSEETKIKMSESRKGLKRKPFKSKGHPQTEETRKKISESRKAKNSKI